MSLWKRGSSRVLSSFRKSVIASIAFSSTASCPMSECRTVQQRAASCGTLRWRSSE